MVRDQEHPHLLPAGAILGHGVLDSWFPCYIVIDGSGGVKGDGDIDDEVCGSPFVCVCIT